MPKRLKFAKPRPDQVLAAIGTGRPHLAPPAGDIAERAARAWALVAARRPELREFDPGAPPWAAVELVRDAAECGDLPDALRALRWAAGEWLFGLAPRAEWDGNPNRGLAHVRSDARGFLLALVFGRYPHAEQYRKCVRRSACDYRAAAEIVGNPDLYPPRYVRLASDWAVWCRRARCALVWLHAAEGSTPPPDDHLLPEEQCP